jgi:hypothetical protein
MKTSDLQIGTVYKIRYQLCVPTLYQVPPPLKSGFGKLLETNVSPGWHRLRLEGTKMTVVASSRGIVKAIDSSSLFMSEEIVPKEAIASEIKELRKMSADDILRRQEIEAITTYLDGLGVKSSPDDDYTEITIKYLDLTTLKAILSHVYHRALLVD